MKKSILLINLLFSCYLTSCSNNSFNIELPYGYELHYDACGTYITGPSVVRYPPKDDIIGFMLSSEYVYGWSSSSGCLFFIIDLPSGTISTFDCFIQYRNALMKLNIMPPSMDQELTAAFLSKGLKEINKQLQTNKIEIIRVGLKKYKVIAKK